MSLIRQNYLTIDQVFIVVDIVEGGCGRPTPADRQIRLNTPYVVILLASVDKERLELAFSHTGFALLHNVDVGF